jgi:hypothetical protein
MFFGPAFRRTRARASTVAVAVSAVPPIGRRHHGDPKSRLSQFSRMKLPRRPRSARRTRDARGSDRSRARPLAGLASGLGHQARVFLLDAQDDPECAVWQQALQRLRVLPRDAEPGPIPAVTRPSLRLRTGVHGAQIPAKKASGRDSSTANQTGGRLPSGKLVPGKARERDEAAMVAAERRADCHVLHGCPTSCCCIADWARSMSPEAASSSADRQTAPSIALHGPWARYCNVGCAGSLIHAASSWSLAAPLLACLRARRRLAVAARIDHAARLRVSGSATCSRQRQDTRQPWILSSPSA